MGWQVVSLALSDYDITDFQQTKHVLKHHMPDIVFHAAAWTQVDECALNPKKALQINGFGTGNLACATRVQNIPMVYISSNEVFDGTQTNRPYYEYDFPNPINMYGYSKYVGEQELVRHNPYHYIIRTSWLFAHGGRNFIQTILTLAQTSDSPLRVVADEIANPTYTDDLAKAIVQLVQTGRFGTYHLTNIGETSRWGLARYVLDMSGLKDVPIVRISHKEWQRPSTPPLYTPLANLLGDEQGIYLRPWQEAVTHFLQVENLVVDT